MYLKTLQIKGFKSFAKKTTLDFERGVTVIVGPNGSGKSNLTDAILWVLGEQSPRSLRGSQMEDVIFTGSTSKPPLGLAEVSLTLDNSDGYLPIEFSEVTVTRRLSRSGVSDYFINGSSARLIDLYDLLSDTGLGRETHCIISQGRIDEILNARSDEKRLLIEEVAGVLKHRKRKERAISKLSSMEQNLLRIRDVAKEVERQLNPLREQAKLAEKAAKLTEQIRETETSIIIFDLFNLQSEWKNKTAKVDSLKEDLQKLKEDQVGMRHEMEAIQQELETKGDFVGDIGEHRRELKGIIERFNSGLLILEEKGKYLIEKLSDLRMQIYRFESSVKAKEDEISTLKIQIEEINKEMEEAAFIASKIEAKIDDQKKVSASLESNVLKLNLELKENMNQVSRKDDELSALALKIETLKIEKEMLGESLKLSAESDAPSTSKIEELKGQLAKIDEELQKMSQDGNVLQRLLSENENQIKKLIIQRRAEEDQLLTIESKIASLSANIESGSLYPDSLKWFLAKDNRRPKEHILSGLIEVKEGYEAAIESALGDILHALISKDLDEAKVAALSLKGEKKGRASIIPLGDFEKPFFVPETPSKGVFASSVVTVRPDIEGAVKAAIGSFLIVSDLTEAIDVIKSPSNRHDVVTLDGDLISKEGIIRVAGSDPAGPIIFKTDLVRLKKKKEAVSAKICDISSAIEKARQDGLKIDVKLSKHKEDLQELLQKASRLKLDRKTEGDHLEQRVKAQKLHEARLIELDELLKLAETGLNDLSIDKQKLIKQRDELKKSIDKAETSLAASNKILSKFLLELNEAQAKKALLSGRIDFLTEQLKTLNFQIAEVKNDLVNGFKTVEARENLRARIQPLHQLFTSLFKSAVDLDLRLEGLALGEKIDTKKSRERHKTLLEAIAPLERDVETIQAEISLIEVDKGQLKLRIEDLTKRLSEDFGISLKEAIGQTPKRINLEEAQERLERLKASQAKIGPVNEVAFQESLSLEERYKFLSEQMADLKKSRNSLHKVIKVIEQKMIDRFYETFQEVNSHFHEIFSRLFPGGQAGMILTGDDDILSCGIEIEANPVGKRLSKITLLSGGERSLVALALLFAIYHTKPSPFYVLDEVEPALDDNNLIRFLTLLEGERVNTQFLIITHQRRTMEIADCLYGVSMQAEGISTVVSQKLDRANEKAS